MITPPSSPLLHAYDIPAELPVSVPLGLYLGWHSHRAICTAEKMTVANMEVMRAIIMTALRQEGHTLSLTGSQAEKSNTSVTITP